MANVKEIIIYIHGVSNDKRGRKHDLEYNQLHQGITKLLPHWPTDKIDIEWGWNYRGVVNPKSHELLTDSQRILGSRVMTAVDDATDFTLNPARAVLSKIRSLIIYGFSDMFYYVSKDGKKAVRNTVAFQIIKQLSPLLNEDSQSLISLTILGHSAGSIAAFDLLFYLFFKNKHNFLVQCNTKAEQNLDKELSKLRALAQNDKLRIRRLITFGSPITALACRSDAILDALAANYKLDVTDYGFDRNPPAFGARLQGPRFINLWDKDDAIAWPVEPLMKSPSPQKLVKDIYIDVSDSISNVHNKYWASKNMHITIAKRW
jgi:hypothetical protein